MSSPVLVVSNDFSLAAAKTSRHLCQALTRLGRTSAGRDTRLIRWAAAEADKEDPARRDAYEEMVAANDGGRRTLPCSIPGKLMSGVY